MKALVTSLIVALSLTASPGFAAECAREINARTKVTDLLLCIVKLNAEVEQMASEVRTLRSAARDVSIPSEAVMAFDDPKGCPPGWSSYNRADGRVILGATHGKSRLSTRFYGEEGGEETVKLTTEEMPSHTHPFSGGMLRRGGWSGDDYKDVAIGGSGEVSGVQITGTIGTAGSGAAHNNMPPYIALYFCKKN